MPARNNKNVYIGAKYDLEDLLKNPAGLMQSLSVKIFNRRDEEMKKLLNTTVYFEVKDGVYSYGELVSYDISHVKLLLEDKSFKKIKMDRLIL